AGAGGGAGAPTACGPGTGDCNDDAGDGCETDTRSSSQHCGYCGRRCEVPGGALGVSCVEGACALQCPAGSGACDNAGQCADLGANYAHCGACGNDCAGAGCNAGACGPAPEPVAVGEGSPTGLAADGEHLYVSLVGPAGGRVVRLPFAGGAPEPVTGEAVAVGGLALDATHVYYVAHATDADLAVRRAPKAGGAPAELAGGLRPPLYLAVGAGQVVFNDYNQNKLLRVPAAGGAVSVLFEGTRNPTNVAVDGERAYWSAANIDSSSVDVAGNGFVESARLDGTDHVVLARGQPGVAGLAVDGGQVYFCNYGSLGLSYQNGGLRRVPAAGGDVVALAPSYFTGHVVVGAGVLYTAERDRVFQTSADAASRTMLGSGKEINAIALSPTHVYWVDADAKRVFRRAR
ncbi:MAG TPA: hypothetical protein VFS00_29830, partial [Polyangiaceae bacterium]|nr:hypothetical protein [Polyangiaceae bacterium]